LRRSGGLVGGLSDKPGAFWPHCEEKAPMALNDTMIRAAKPREKDWKLADERGLYLLVTCRGSKLWRVKFRVNG